MANTISRSADEKDHEDHDDKQEVLIDLEAQQPLRIPPGARNKIGNVYNNMDYRGEERWHASIDALARQWRNVCEDMALKHDKAGYGARVKHFVFGLPAPITALVTTAVVSLWDSEDSKYFVVPATCLAAILSTVHTFLDMGGRAQRHWDYSARYGGICSKIDVQLVRDVDFRRPADEFIAETRTEIGNLNSNAPQLPDGRYCCSRLFGCSCGAAESGEASVAPPDFDGVTSEDMRRFRRANAGNSEI